VEMGMGMGMMGGFTAGGGVNRAWSMEQGACVYVCVVLCRRQFKESVGQCVCVCVCVCCVVPEAV